MTYPNTVKDVSRAVAALDEACSSILNYDDAADAAERVARNLAYQFSKHYGTYGMPGARCGVSTEQVRAALVSHGASPFTVEQFARRIAKRIREQEYLREVDTVEGYLTPSPSVTYPPLEPLPEERYR